MMTLAGDRVKPPDTRTVSLGLRQNIAQFSLLVAVNALVGGMIGQERTVLPLLAHNVFHLGAFTAALTFIVAFGVVKAATNFFAGTLSDRVGRKPVLVAGWLIAIPVPFLLMWGPTWGYVILANVLLGINQGLTWSTTVIMKIDLVGPERRGLAMGLNEAAGYGAVALTALATGFIAGRTGLRPDPFFLGIAFAALGLGLSTLFVRETLGHARREAYQRPAQSMSTKDVFVHASFREKALSAASQAGMVNNMNDGLAWGIFPVLFTRGGLSVAQIGVLVALYPAVWGAGQLVTGALSDRIGRKWLIACGMWLQAIAIAMIGVTRGFGPWAAGALLAGVIADLAGIGAAISTVAVLTALSGVVVAVRMYETHRAARPVALARIPSV
jgi:MFS family permease